MTLKVVTINILSDLSYWKVRRDLIIAELIDLSPDVVMLQEVSLPENPAIWLANQLNIRMSLPNEYTAYVCPKSGKWGQHEAIAIISRIPVESYEYIPLGEQGRVAQKIIVEVNEQKTALINVHLFWQPGYSTERIRQVRKMIDWADQKPGSFPLLICGDFNDSPDSETISIIKERYRSAYESVHEREPEYTYPTPLPVSFLHLLKILITFFPLINIKSLRWDRRSTLDYIFVNHLVSVHDCRLAFDTPHLDDAKIYPSDHIGLVAEVFYEE